MLRLVPLFLLGGCLFAPGTPTNQDSAPPAPYVTASLTDDGTDAPTLDVSLCHEAFLGCNSTGAIDVINICDGAGCRTFDPTTPYGSTSFAETVSTTVTLGTSPVRVAWDDQAGFTLPLPEGFTPTTDRSTYAATDVVKVTWAPSQAGATMSYSFEELCDSSASSDSAIPVPTMTGVSDPGELDVMAGMPGLSGQTCQVTLTLLRELPAVLDATASDEDVHAHAAEARSVTYAVTE